MAQSMNSLPGVKLLPDLPAGVYRHWKGHLYQVLGYGHDANTDLDRFAVVYIGLQTQGSHTGPRLAFRTAMSDDPSVDAFFDFVHKEDGSKCAEPHDCLNNMTPIRRFTYLGPGTREEDLK